MKGHSQQSDLYIRSDVNYIHRVDLENNDLEAIWIEILVEKWRSIYLVSCIDNRTVLNICIKILTRTLKTFYLLLNCENKEVILSGDLNCNYLIANDHKEIKVIIKINGLKQIIDKATRISKDSSIIIWNNCFFRRFKNCRQNRITKTPNFQHKLRSNEERLRYTRVQNEKHRHRIKIKTHAQNNEQMLEEYFR